MYSTFLNSYSQVGRYLRVWLALFLFFFNDCTCVIWKFLDKELNPSHSCYIHCSCGNASSFNPLCLWSNMCLHSNPEPLQSDSLPTVPEWELQYDCLIHWNSWWSISLINSITWNSCQIKYHFIWIILLSDGLSISDDHMDNTKWFWLIQGNLEAWCNIHYSRFRD